MLKTWKIQFILFKSTFSSAQMDVQICRGKFKVPPMPVVILSGIFFHILNCCFSFYCSTNWFVNMANASLIEPPPTRVPRFIWPDTHPMIERWIRMSNGTTNWSQPCNVTKGTDRGLIVLKKLIWLTVQKFFVLNSSRFYGEQRDQFFRNSMFSC